VCMPVVIALGQIQPQVIRSDEEDAYWTNHGHGDVGQGQVMRFNMSVGRSELPAYEQRGPRDIAVYAGYVFWRRAC
jgi:hypothetical protein